jgi:7,8-dihydroneopterin aldolase/epimerase/oxygenase
VPPLDSITLNGMRFHALVGVLPHEREHPQPIEVDLTTWVRDASGVLDYRRLYAHVRAALQAPELLYLEDVAESIARRVLREERVQRARVAVRKPHAALGGPLNFAGVSITRERDA